MLFARICYICIYNTYVRLADYTATTIPCSGCDVLRHTMRKIVSVENALTIAMYVCVCVRVR